MWAAVAVIALLVVACALMAGRMVQARERAAKANDTFALRFVMVEDDGSARTLTADEVAHLNTEFYPVDGARPYIKASYSALTPDGRIGGYLLRRKLPPTVLVQRSTVGAG